MDPHGTNGGADVENLSQTTHNEILFALEMIKWEIDTTFCYICPVIKATAAQFM